MLSIKRSVFGPGQTGSEERFSISTHTEENPALSMSLHSSTPQPQQGPATGRKWSGNLALASLSEATLPLLEPFWRSEFLEKGVVLWDQQPSDRVLFPMSGLVSLICPTAAGHGIEFGNVGRESALGFSSHNHSRAEVRVAGAFLTVPIERFWSAAQRS